MSELSTTNSYRADRPLNAELTSIFARKRQWWNTICGRHADDVGSESTPHETCTAEMSAMETNGHATRSHDRNAFRDSPHTNAEPSIGDLFGRLGQDASHLIQQELQLARIEMRESARQLGGGIARLLAAASLVWIGLLALTATAIVALGNAIDSYSLSSLIVGALFLIVGGLLLPGAMRTIRSAAQLPETVATLRSGARWAADEKRAVRRELTS